MSESAHQENMLSAARGRTQADRGADWEVGRQLERKDAEIDRLRAVILNIWALADRGFPLDQAKLAERCRRALGVEQAAPGTGK